MRSTWPRFSDYNVAFHSPETGFIPLELKQATVARNGFGSPDPLSGGFAYIYRITLPNGKKKAVRVFIQDDPVRDKRIPWVLDRLREEKDRNPALQDLFLDCQWIDPCVHTQVGDVPAMVMDWSEGQTLGEWLRKHRGKPEKIEEFRAQFRRTMELLDKSGIAHGDLQLGNILVNRLDHPILVDYDGLSFFDEDTPPPIQGGHPNFQHPARSNDLPSSQLDRFPAITIELGLAAWVLFSKESWFISLVSDSDRLFFSRSDFLDPEHSEAFTRLKECPSLAQAVTTLQTLCKSDPRNLPTLAEFCSLVLPLRAVSVPEHGVQPTVHEIGEEKPVSPKRRKKKAWEEKETEYLPVFPLFSALDVASLSQKVGEMVEVIGKVTELHEGETKYGDPYVFVNFMDWREPRVFHLVAWSEDLDDLENPPSEEWVGKWIQVTGLLEEPYVRKSFRGSRVEQVRYSIRIRQDHQFRFLSVKEAKARLKSAATFTYSVPSSIVYSSSQGPPTMGFPVLSSPKELKDKRPSLKEPNAPSFSPAFPISSNQELLKKLESLSPSDSMPSSYSSSPTKSQSPKESSGGFAWLIWIALFVLVLYLLGFVK
ncbi:MAG: hypothetical protein N2442_14530 [Spirochaetes bacterium]|nr:hypothetical protein [Spirochaetota bacterium]